MTEQMNSIERTYAVLRGGIPDRVPVDLHNFMVTAYASGMSFPEYFRNGEAMAEGQIRPPGVSMDTMCSCWRTARPLWPRRAWLPG